VNAILKSIRRSATCVEIPRHDRLRIRRAVRWTRAALRLEVLEDRSLPSTSLPLSTITWTELGADPIQAGGELNAGRVTGIAADPSNPSTLYLAAAGGGVWRTIDAGQSWSPMTDQQAIAFMGAIAVAPNSPNIVYAGMGEANLGPDKIAIGRDNIYYGRGILRSIDAGATWQLFGQSDFDRRTISRIVVDPSNPNVVYAAVGAQATNGLPGNTGIWKSIDAGADWVDATGAISTTAAFSDVAINPANPGVLYAAAGEPGGSLANGLYATVDGGASWFKEVNFPSGATDARVGRITIAIAPSAPQVIYASVAASGQAGSQVGTLLFVARSLDGGTTWAALPAPNFMGGAGDYDTALAVDPSNPNEVYAAGQAGPSTLIRTLDGGATWQDIGVGADGAGPHVDHHALTFDAAGRLLDGNDGGIWRLDDPRPGFLHWTNLNSKLGITQFTGVALHPLTGNIAYGGSQDNGTEEFTDNRVWNVVQGGDGGFVRVDPTDPATVYHTFFYSGTGFLERSDDGGRTWAGKTAGINTSDPAHFYPPYVLDPSNPTRLVLGTNRVYESLNRADSWAPLSTPGVAGWSTSGRIDAVAIAATNGNAIYAAAGGHVFVTTNRGASWSQRDPVPGPSPALRWGAIAIDPTNYLTAYIVAATFSDRSGGHVWRTTNGGTTWTNITSNLPDLPVWSMVLDTHGPGSGDDVIYLGTDLGVYFSANQGVSWAPLGLGLPNAQVSDLEISPRLGILAAATHGRGMWELALPRSNRIIVTGADVGGGPALQVFDARTGAQEFGFFAYSPAFHGGVRVAVGDVNGDGIADIVTAPGPGGGPDIRVFDGNNGNLIRDFLAYAPQFSGGVYVAVADVNGDGFADIITAAGAGGGPHVEVFSGKDGSLLRSFMAYAPTFAGGVRVAAGDVDGDGLADIITGAGPGGGPHVKVFSGATGALLRSFYAYAPIFTGGVYVAADDINGDGRADIITGAGPGGGPQVNAFSGLNNALLQSFMAYDPRFTGGVRVAAADVNGAGHAAIVTAPGAGGGPDIIARDGITLAVLDNFFAYEANFAGGVFVGAAAGRRSPMP
jgi:hypothetical protein